MINISNKNIRDTARLFNEELVRIKVQTQLAKDKIGVDYLKAIDLAPLFARCSRLLKQYQDSGIDIDAIGNIWAVDYNAEWVNVKPVFLLLRTDISETRAWLLGNASIFAFNVDPIDGSRLYNIEIPADKKTELTALLESILSRF